MSPIDNPEYRDEAEAIVTSVGKIKDAIAEHGMGSVTIMLILGELMALATIVNNFNKLPASQRDEFFAEVWDAAIGNEPNSLLSKVGIFSGEALEKMSDGLKAGALAYFNSKIPQLPA